MTPSIEPVEGMVAIKILDDIDGDYVHDNKEREESEHYGSAPPPIPAEEFSEALIALVLGVGKGVKCCKKGDTVLVNPWSMTSVRIGTDERIIRADQVLAKVG